MGNEEWLYTENIVKDLTRNIKNYSLDAIIRILESILKDDFLHFVRLKSDIMLNIPPYEVSKITVSGRYIDIYCNRFGIANMQSCLPNSYIEEFLIYKKISTNNFFNIFNNKLLKLSYETSKSYDIAIQNVSFRKSNYAKILSAFAGEFEHLEEKYSIIINNALLFWKKPRSLFGLKLILEKFLGNKVELENNIGGFDDISSNSLTSLGIKNNELGKNTIVGTKLWNQNKIMKIFFKDVSVEDFKDFLEDRKIINVLHFIIKKYINFSKEFRILFKVQENCITNTLLNGTYKLSLNTWLKSNSKYQDIINIPKSFIGI